MCVCELSVSTHYIAVVRTTVGPLLVAMKPSQECIRITAEL